MIIYCWFYLYINVTVFPGSNIDFYWYMYRCWRLWDGFQSSWLYVPEHFWFLMLCRRNILWQRFPEGLPASEPLQTNRSCKWFISLMDTMSHFIHELCQENGSNNRIIGMELFFLFCFFFIRDLDLEKTLSCLYRKW